MSNLEETNKLIQETHEAVQAWLRLRSKEDQKAYEAWRERRLLNLAIQFFGDTGRMDNEPGIKIGFEYVLDRQTLDNNKECGPNWFKDPCD